jgi:hypothetical protein
MNDPAASRPHGAALRAHGEAVAWSLAMMRSLQLCLITLAVTIASAAGVMPAAACMPATSMDQVDRALAATRLTGSKRADANALRDDMAEALLRRDVRAAAHLETQAMGLMGYQQAEGPVYRGGCGPTWVRKAG